jgi:hypothetical protein
VGVDEPTVPAAAGVLRLMTVKRAVAELTLELERARHMVERALNEWRDANDDVRRHLVELESLCRSPLPPDVARHRPQVEAGLRSAEHREASARVKLTYMENLEQHVYARMQFMSEHDLERSNTSLQRSMRRATWMMAAVAAAALLVSAWAAWRPPPPMPPRAIHVEVVQPVANGAAPPGPWRPEIVDVGRR